MKIAVDSFVIWCNKAYPIRGNGVPLKSKNNYFMWYRPISISNVQPNCAKFAFVLRASFKDPQTMDNCSLQPGTFSIHCFSIDVLLKWLFFIKWVSRHLDTKPKHNFPSTFRRTIGRRSEIFQRSFDLGDITFLGSSPQKWYFTFVKRIFKNFKEILA